MADATAPATPEAEDRITLASVRRKHVALMQRLPGKPDSGARPEMEAMRQEIVAAGRWLDDWIERDSAQSLIDYWTATIAGLPDSEDYPDLLELAPFDPATVRSLRDMESPFVGLNPFGARDRRRFFGRDHAAAALLETVLTHPLTIVSGPSGSGKSSLVLAGLVPLLQEQDRRPILPPVAPGNDPVAALLQAVRPPDAPANWLDRERATAMRTPARIAELAEALPGAGGGAVLLLDQAEELFTFDIDGAARQAALAAIAALIARPAPHRVVLTIRSDYLDALRAEPALFPPRIGAAQAPAIFTPDPLTSRELHDAIVGPAEQIGLRIDPDVVEDLVREVIGEPAALPLLQFALSRLWAQAETDRIGWPDYEAVGKPSEALCRTAERLYEELRLGENKDAARLVFLALVKPAQGAESVRRRARRETLSRLAASERIDRVLAHFVAGGLLRRTPGQDADDDRFEVAHETLIRHWPRLAGWLDERRRADASRERLLAAAEQWRKSGRVRGYLLAGTALDQAAEHAGTSPELDEFIAESRRHARSRLSIYLALAIGVAAMLLTVTVYAVVARNEAIAKAGAARRSQAAALRADARASVEASRADEADVLVSGADARTEAAEQTLARLLAAGAIAAEAVPPALLPRLRPAPPVAPAAMRPLKGYDPNFLAAPLPLPVPSRGLVRLDYRNLSILYDPARRLPLVASANIDRTARDLPEAAGRLPLDPRLPAGQQPGGLEGTGAQTGRVPLIGWTETGWGTALPAGTNRADFRPATVTQPWAYHQGPWAEVTGAIAGLKPSRLVIAAGPVLRPDDRVVDGTPVPTAFWKLAVYRDEANTLQSQAFVVPVGAPSGGGVARFRVGLAELQRVTGFDLRRIADGAGVGDRVAPDTKTTVYLQFAVMPRHRARAITAALAQRGYVTPGEERVASASGKHELRYYHREDAATAARLARDTEAALAALGFGKVAIAPRLLRLKNLPVPRPHLFELWIGLPAPAAG